MTCSWDKARSVFCGISSDGRLYIFFDEPFALQLGNGIRWMEEEQIKIV